VSIRVWWSKEEIAGSLCLFQRAAVSWSKQRGGGKGRGPPLLSPWCTLASTATVRSASHCGSQPFDLKYLNCQSFV